MSNLVDSARTDLRRTNVKLRIASVPSWAVPVQQGSCTQVSRVGNRGKSQTVPLLLPDLFGAEYALEAIRSKPVYPVHIYVTKTYAKVHMVPVRRSRVFSRPITSAKART